VRSSIGYRIALLLVTTAMILLPAIYLALVAGAGWVVVWWARVGLSLFEHRVGLGTFVVYLAPLVVGGLLVLFLIKPLFARRGSTQESFSIDRRSQPLFVAYVEHLCRATGAPIPSRIDVDVRVNASASFRRGLLSLLGQDLVLTIGLPLVATMDIRQLTSVLAHEFGHFSQGAGMRFSYLTVVINRWFARVAYERDEWDDKLAEWSQESDFRIAVVLWIARFGIWCSRLVLRLLMRIGHLLSMLLSRQMEFDADQHAVRVAGHQTFAQTMRLLLVLDLAERGAHSDLGLAWSEGRLGDDLPALIKANLDQVPEDLRKQAITAAMGSTAGMYASHPATGQRIARAEATPEVGILAINGPAAGLFNDFPGLCRTASLSHYRDVIGPEVGTHSLQATAALVDQAKRIEAQRRAVVRVFGELWGWIRLCDPRTQAAATADDPVARVAVMAGHLLAAVEQAGPAIAERKKAAEEQVRYRIGSELSVAGQAIDLKSFGVEDHQRLVPALARINRQVEERQAGLAAAESAGCALIAAAVAAAEAPERLPASVVAAEILAARTCLVALAAAQAAVRDLRLGYAELSALCEHLQAHQGEEKYINVLLARMEENRKALAALRQIAEAYPFNHERPGIAIGAFLVPEVPAPRDLGAAMRAGGQALERCFTLHHRCLGVIAEAVERLHGQRSPTDGSVAMAATAT
jgi:Zn-dependent protease with chaperone function